MINGTWLCCFAYFIVLVQIFWFGLRITQKKEYLGKRRTGFFQVQEYQLDEERAGILGKSYMIGATLMAFSSIVLIAAAAFGQQNWGGYCGGILWFIGIIIIVAGNVISHSGLNLRMPDQDEQP